MDDGLVLAVLVGMRFADPLPASGAEGVYLDSPIVLRGHGWSIGGSPVLLSGFDRRRFRASSWLSPIP